LTPILFALLLKEHEKPEIAKPLHIKKASNFFAF